jgi:hypothetical protein
VAVTGDFPPALWHNAESVPAENLALLSKNKTFRRALPAYGGYPHTRKSRRSALTDQSIASMPHVATGKNLDRCAAISERAAEILKAQHKL